MIKKNIFLYGEGGSGKSCSIATLFKLLPKIPELKVRYLMTEANAMEGMIDGLKLHKIELKPEQLYYQVCRPDSNVKYTTKNIADDFRDNFVNASENEAMKVKIGVGDRSKHIEFLEILKGLASFKGIDYVTKERKDLGDYLKWDDNTILVVDSFTSAVDYLIDVAKGPRVATTLQDYKNVQTNIMSKLIIPLTEKGKCSIIMLGHPQIGEDQNVKQPKEAEDRITRIYPKSFGQKINSTLMYKFSETVYSYTVNRKYYWAGYKEGIATSCRKIPKEDRLAPDFSLYPIFEMEE